MWIFTGMAVSFVSYTANCKTYCISYCLFQVLLSSWHTVYSCLTLGGHWAFVYSTLEFSKLKIWITKIFCSPAMTKFATIS